MNFTQYRWCVCVFALLSLPDGVRATGLEQVWRCGQTLTNQAPADEAQRATCVLVELPRMNRIEGTRIQSAKTRTADASARAMTEKTASAQIDAVEQKNRDAVARQMLLAERQRLLMQVEQARKQADDTGLARAQADLAALDRELTRWP